MRRAWIAIAMMTWVGCAAAQAYDPVDIAAIRACPSFEAPRRIVQNLSITRLNEMQRRRNLYGVRDTCKTAQTVQAAFVEHRYGGGAHDSQVASATEVWRHYGLPAVSSQWVPIRDPQ